MLKEQPIPKKNTSYTPDLLGDQFERCTLKFTNDYEGPIDATLIRRKSGISTTKAVLYIHGFNDYFFQSEMAKCFNDYGFHFYALDLRKYGRSFLTHQKLNNVRSLTEYDEEISLALQIIKSEGNHQVILNGHSTGGLIITNYAVRYPNSTLFQGLICNSPFYEFNLPFFEREIGIPLFAFIGKYLPNLEVPAGFTKVYGHSLHNSKQGEWNYSLSWKPLDIANINLGFLTAIYQAQKNIQYDANITVPTLVMHSDRSIYEKHYSEKLKTGDAVLNVQHIQKYAHQLTGDITVCEIKNGMHDLVLSTKPVREKVYKRMFEWIGVYFK
ncbi:alpha/beta hydrolase [Flavobacterium sp. 7A]|uniref:alpha/beta hydrolase n=1 Tax=Flavobacterium sp. 7A TaxID=2940571 RepID=UPI002226EC0D|nr:alpha/beta hydrolase [Flavobacterium sp. 7A]MCW2119391.1 alpha-beta hydrolase superfamily lysophospholipase [Flavobacterium sp. 7A]